MKAAKVFSVFFAICGGLLAALFLLLTGGYSLAKKTVTYSVDHVKNGLRPDVDAIEEDTDYRMEIRVLNLLLPVDGKVLGFFKIQNSFYCSGSFVGADGELYHCLLSVPEGTELYDRIRTVREEDGRLDPDTLPKVGYYEADEITLRPERFRQIYDEDREWYNENFFGQQGAPDMKFLESGKTFFFLGYSEEEYLRTKEQQKEYNVNLLTRMSCVFLLPPIAVLFLLSFLLKRAYKKRAAAARNAESAGGSPDAGPWAIPQE